jgi:SAM-dependent methyltransferase
MTPVDPHWGFNRGVPIDRTYIETFLASHSSDVTGRVLEVASPRYTEQFGQGVERSDVLMVAEGNPLATIVADLTDAPQIPDASFDCAIVTQTLQFIYDTRAAVETIHRILAPGGVLLCTVPGITKISETEDADWGQWWHFTAKSAGRLTEEVFGKGQVQTRSYGNVLTAISFLHGLASSDLRPIELEHQDPLYEVIIGIHAEKAGS